MGVLASEHWGMKYPKFYTPELKAELTKFAAKISVECLLPEAGFNEEGIRKHIKDFFSEQRRYKRRMVSKKINIKNFKYLYVISVYIINYRM